MCFLKILMFTALFNLYNAVYVLPSKTILTRKGESYTILIKDDKLTPVQCFLDDGKSKYELDIDVSGVPAKLMRTTELNTQKTAATDVITSLGGGVCGFKIDYITTPVVNWNISFIDESNKIYSEIRLAFIRDMEPPITKIVAAVGDKISIEGCGINLSHKQFEIYYCQVYNPSGELVMMDKQLCSYSKSASTTADFGTWKCLINYQTSMADTVIEYEVIQYEKDIINTWKNETETHVNVGCSITNSSEVVPSFCVMVRPDGDQFVLTPGKATQRYTSLKTNLTNNICNMEILKPLDSTEKGLWRCELHGGINGPIGGFIDLSTLKSAKKDDQVQTPKNVFANINTTFSARCRVPYSSPYCYMIGADGLMYPVENDRSPTLGLCEFKKTSALTDNGTWYCGYGMQNGEPDKLYPFTVIVPEILGVKAEKETVDAYSSSSARLMCTTNTMGNYPLKYCRFRSPNGDIYFIGDKQTTDRISYSGRGLVFGDCGILIHDVKKDDEGIWSCITRIGNDFTNKEVYTNMHLSVSENMSVASAVGIAMGVGIVVIGILVITAHRINSRRRRGVNATFSRNATARSSNSSNSSANSAVIFNLEEPSTSRNYNSTDHTQTHNETTSTQIADTM